MASGGVLDNVWRSATPWCGPSTGRERRGTAPLSSGATPATAQTPCDLTVQLADNHIVQSHRAILYPRCPKLQSLASPSPDGSVGDLVLLPEVSKATFAAVLAYCWTGQLDVDTGSVMALLHCCEGLLGMAEVGSFCSQFVEDNVDAATAMYWLDSARQVRLRTSPRAEATA